jgi:phosphatidylglycerophosphatase A
MSSIEPLNRTAHKKIPFIVKFYASAFFSGYSPVASGTAGSIVGLLIYFIPGFEEPYIILPAILLCFVLGVLASTKMEDVYGNDPAEVVIDEVVGMWISLLLLPKMFLLAIFSFLIFRLFDIIKPLPANIFNKKCGGYWVMMDDVVAGVYANILSQVVFVIAARITS